VFDSVQTSGGREPINESGQTIDRPHGAIRQGDLRTLADDLTMMPSEPMNDNQTRRAATHQVIVNGQDQFVVWPTRLQPPSGWRCIGVEGTRSELDTYMRKVAAETLPMPLLITDSRMLDTRWD
jgi:MbtH protein